LAGPQNRDLLVARLSALAFPRSDRHDHSEAADVRTGCRMGSVQIGLQGREGLSTVVRVWI
jgi:hypothetical protein